MMILMLFITFINYNSDKIMTNDDEKMRKRWFSERLPFATQKVTFQCAICHLLHAKRWHIAKRVVAA